MVIRCRQGQTVGVCTKPAWEENYGNCGKEAVSDERVHNVYDESGARSNKETTLLLRGGEIL